MLIQRVVEELRDALTGRFFGKVYQLGPVSFAIDFGLRGEFLFISVDPSNPRFYLIRRRTKDLEKQSTALNSFGQTMRSRLSGAHVVNISKDPLDRIVRLTFRKEDLSPALEIAVKRFRQIQSQSKEITDLKETLETRKLIERAKGILMDRHGLKEEDAFKRIHFQARNQNKKMREIAESIITASELI